MGNNLIPYSIAIGEENIYLTPEFEFIKREKLKILNRWKQLKISMICLIIVIQIVKTRLKN